MPLSTEIQRVTLVELIVVDARTQEGEGRYHHSRTVWTMDGQLVTASPDVTRLGDVWAIDTARKPSNE